MSMENSKEAFDMNHIFFRIGVAYAFLQFFGLPEISAQDSAERFMLEARNRAQYWNARGYEFDPLVTTADSMDRRVQDLRRAEYWRDRGFQFDANRLSAWAMDRKAEAKLREEYWRQWGIEFNSDLMDAATMDDAAVKLQQIRTKLAEVEREGEESPAIIVDDSVATLMAEPPKVRGAVMRRNPQLPAAGQFNRRNSPIAVPSGTAGSQSGQGSRAGRGNRGQFPLQTGSNRSANSVQIPPGTDPERFFQFLQRLELPF